MLRLFAAAGMLALAGCVSVTHQTPEAVFVTTWSLGLFGGCGVVGIGLQYCRSIRMDPKTCAAIIIVEHPDPQLKGLAGRLESACRKKET